MSLTRDLMTSLRASLGAADPMPSPPPLPVIPPPPVRIFPTPRTRSRFQQQASEHTTALVGIGHVGTRYATDVVLQFQAELAVAHEAVGTVLPEDWAEKNGLLPLNSQVEDHREFLLRPDKGRRLNAASVQRLREKAIHNVDIQPILADGLSAVACMGSGLALLNHFIKACEARGWRVGTPMCARFARVWLEDEIGQEVNAKVAAILLGERPGLGTGDGLSTYLVYEPRIGKTDGNRNMMSNIHARGTPPEQAAKRMALLVGAMLEQRTSGVDLDLAKIKSELGDAGGTGYRAPEPRVKLVDV